MTRRVGDYGAGGCARCREQVSAALDGEADPSREAAVDAHLAACADCRRWRSGATRVTRLARTGPAEPGLDLVGGVLAATTRTRRSARRRSAAARVALAAVGLAQVALGVAALLGAAAHGGMDGSMLGAGMAHLSHESAAWGVALGVAFVAGARWTRHLSGLLPVLGAFILVLAATSTLDLLDGRVDAARVASHLLLVAGFLLSVLVGRHADTGPGDGPGTASRLRRFLRRQEPTDDLGRPAVAPTIPARPSVGSEQDPVARRTAG